MSGNIKLSPAELIAQATQMQSVQSQMESLFTSITNDLNSINESWSANLAHNFAAKIANSQKCFSNISEMLLQGSNIALESARTFESVDSLLGRVINGAGETVSNIGSAFVDEIFDKYKSDIFALMGDDAQNIYNIIDEISKNPEQYPETIKNALKDYLNEIGLGEVVTATEDINDISKAIAAGDVDALKNIIVDKATPYIENLGDGSLNDNIVVGTTLNAINNLYNDAQVYIKDPSMKNATMLMWNVTGGAMSEALVDNAYSLLSKTPVFGELMENTLAEYGGGMEGLSNLTNETMEVIMGSDWMNYYKENGGYFNGVYNGLTEIINYAVENPVAAVNSAVVGTAEGLADFAKGSVDYVMSAVKAVKDCSDNFGIGTTVESLSKPVVDAIDKYIIENSKSVFNSIFG